MALLSSVDFGFATGASSLITIFFLLGGGFRSNQGFILLITMLHCERPILICVSALTSITD